MPDETNSYLTEPDIRESQFPPHIGALEFYARARELELSIRDAAVRGTLRGVDALFGIKRSGWVLGTFLSHRLELPLFAKSELSSIPAKFGRIMIVDTVAWTGRSIRRAATHLAEAGFTDLSAAVLFSRPECRTGGSITLVSGGTCNHIPVFFFHKDFRFDFSHDPEYLEKAASTAL